MNLFSHLTDPELKVRNAIQAAHAADLDFEATLTKHKASRWESCEIPDVVAARQAYHSAANAMNQAFQECRASGSIYPLLTH